MNAITVPSNRLDFDEAKHEYRLDGKVIPGVTSILGRVGLYPDFKFVDKYYRDRGTQVHQAIDEWCKGTLKRVNLRPDVVGFLDGFERFAEDTNLEVITSEFRGFHGDLGYGLTVDNLGVFSELRGGKRELSLIDYKCGMPYKGYRYQLLAYMSGLFWMAKNGLLPFPLTYPMKLYTVHLKKDGTYFWIRYDDNDIQEWYAAVKLYQALQRRNKWDRKTFGG